MTLRELLQMAGAHWIALLGIFISPPCVAALCGWLHGRGRGNAAPWKYLYALLLYSVCLPGIFACVLTAYALFFTNENLLDVNPLVYFLPIVSLAVSLVLIKRNVDFKEVPGFDRLWGLVILIAISFGLALAIHRTRIWIFFGGSIQTLFGLAVGIFALLKLGAHLLTRRKDQGPTEA